MPHGRRFSRGSAPASRRQTAWQLGPGGDDSQFDPFTVTATSIVFPGSAVTPVIPNLTVVRIRG